MKDSKMKEKFKTIIDESEKAIIVCGDTGVGVFGDKVSVCATLCSLFESFGKDGKLSKKDIEGLLDIVFNNDGKVKSIKELKKEALLVLSNMLKELGE